MHVERDSHSEASDAELVHLFQQGDETAFNRLVLRYQERLYWLARRFCGDHDTADDVVQDVFVKAYETLKTFRGESSLFTWLYRVTVNVALNALRKKRAHEFLRWDEYVETEATVRVQSVERSDHSGPRENPADLLEANEQQRLIEEAVARLPARQKAVFIMRYYEELPYGEIAKVLKTSVGGLKANYFHAVKKIGEYLRRAHESR